MEDSNTELNLSKRRKLIRKNIFYKIFKMILLHFDVPYNLVFPPGAQITPLPQHQFEPPAIIRIQSPFKKG